MEGDPNTSGRVSKMSYVAAHRRGGRRFLNLRRLFLGCLQKHPSPNLCAACVEQGHHLATSWLDMTDELHPSMLDFPTNSGKDRKRPLDFTVPVYFESAVSIDSEALRRHTLSYFIDELHPVEASPSSTVEEESSKRRKRDSGSPSQPAESATSAGDSKGAPAGHQEGPCGLMDFEPMKKEIEGIQKCCDENMYKKVLANMERLSSSDS